MIVALVAVPAAAGLLAFALRWDRPRRALLAMTALAHAGMTVAAWPQLDATGRLFLSITSALFLAAVPYAIDMLRRKENGEAVFTGCLLLFLASMTGVTVTTHFGLLWVAAEATTLASAPLIYFHRDARSLEATWKYLLVCSVGIALALLGNFFLAGANVDVPLEMHALVRHAATLNVPWLKAAFLCFLVGYGTKMGLAPLHTWLPDAHSESPSVVSALLSGALLNCAFVGILRAVQVCAAAGLASFAQELLVLFGLISMGTAAVFILGQPDYKRMLAYSSVEHMGILALGVGLGGAATFGAMLHALNHSLVKASLFMVAGNLLAAYGTKTSAEVRGALRVAPVSGALWIAGVLAITGFPPFGTFISEFTILRAALDQGRPVVASIYVALLALVFVGMTASALPMAQGTSDRPVRRESALSLVSPVLMMAAVLALGVFVPRGFGP